MPVLQAVGITKVFPGVKALDNVDFDLEEGEVHALVGENGAGKSTLIKIISGVYKPDAGQIKYNGRVVSFSSPVEAINAGISTIHQELNLFEYLTVAENIYVGQVESFNIRKRELIQRAKKLLKELKFNISPSAKVKELNTSEKQLVAIARALSMNSKIIIMDEPTATITEHETKRLFEIIKDLKKKGISVIFISHRLEEVFEIADRVSILRDGRLVGRGKVEEFDQESLINLMVGRKISDMYPKFNSPTNEIAFSVSNLNVKGIVKGVTFSVRKGEIFGVAGLVGSGKSEIALGVYGYLNSSWDELIVDGKRIQRIKSPTHAISEGIALVPEDRKSMGLVMELDILKNIILHNTDEVTNLGVIQWRKAKKIAEEESGKYNVKASSIRQKVKTLSGGNQQKVVLAKVFRKVPKVVFMVEPTRGIDVGAKVEVYNIINSIANKGVGVVFISSELPEIVKLSDRVMVMHRGRMMGVLEGEEINQENILSLATGVVSV